MRLSIKRLFVTATASVFLFTSTTLFAADATRPVVECLPEDTMMMVRMPSGQKFLDEMRAHTKLGRVLLSKERIDNAFKKIKEKNAADFAKVEAELAKVGLKVDDLRDMFGGDTGIALSFTNVKAPVPYVYMWVEPQGDLGKKLYTAMKTGIEQSKEADKPVRTDLKIEGVEVTKLVSGQFRMETPTTPLPDNYDKMTEAERDKWEADEAAKPKVPVKVKTGESVMFMALMGNRIIATVSSTEKRTNTPVDVAETQARFGAFLKSHLAAGKGATFADRFNAPAIQEVLPSGVVGMDAYLDTAAFMKLAVAAAEPKGGKDPAKVFDALGLNNLGAAAARISMAGTLMKSSGFLATPGPRKGLLSLLDQPEFPSEPAAWATSSLQGYAHWSFDLAKAYKVIQAIAIEMEGPEAGQSFDMAEAQVQQNLKVDIATILGSFGNQHSVGIHFPEQPAKAGEETPAEQIQPMALVWNLTNQDIWNQIIQVLTPMATGPGGMVAAKEQGFTGFRSGPNMPFEGALLTGKNLLMIAVGKQVAEQTLAAVNTPPQGEASMKQGKAFARAKTLVKLRPSIGFAFASNDRTADHFIENLMKALEAGMRGPNSRLNDAEIETFIEFYKAILPKDEELKGAFGLSVTQAYNTPKGTVLESVSEFPKE